MSPKTGEVKFVEEVPGSPSGFGGGGHAMDLSPIVEALKANPGKWALIEEGRKSLGSLQRLPVEFDVEISTRQGDKRTYTGKDGSEKVTFTINVYGRYVEGFSKGHVDKLKTRATERGTGFAANTLIHKQGQSAPAVVQEEQPAQERPVQTSRKRR